jgi:hypothetical protein
MILIGSCALQQHVKLPDGRKISDQDYVGTYEEAMELRKQINATVCFPINGGKSIYMRGKDGSIVEVEIAWPDSMAERLVKFVESQEDNLTSYIDVIIPSLDVLYLLKLSHRYKKDSPHWLKTLRDIQFMRKLGAKIRPEHEEFLKQREKETYDNILPKLSQSKNGFFKDDIYTWDHDTIHQAVAIGSRPAYLEFKPADSEVMVSKKMWDECSDQIKLNAAYEEICVLCIERALVPFPDKWPNPKKAFDLAHMKLGSSISGGWFREFVYERYDDIQAMYSDEFVTKFEQGLATGVVKPHRGGK